MHVSTEDPRVTANQDILMMMWKLLQLLKRFDPSSSSTKNARETKLGGASRALISTRHVSEAGTLQPKCKAVSQPRTLRTVNQSECRPKDVGYRIWLNETQQLGTSRLLQAKQRTAT